jgi:hypothetical protein
VTQVKETLLSAPTLAEAAGARPLLDLSEPERAGLRTTNAAQINALIDNVSGASARVEGAPAAAFDALVTLVDNAKRESVDLAQPVEAAAHVRRAEREVHAHPGMQRQHQASSAAAS